MIRANLVVLVLFAVAATGRVRASEHNGARSTEFSREASEVGVNDVRITPRETWRIEHFLGAVFPVWQMRRCAWEAADRPASYLPDSRRVTYAVISQQGFRFVLAGYHVEWRDAEGRNVAVNELAIYRMEPAGPNQVWRSRPWRASYPELHFWTSKSGWRNVILFQEGGLLDDRSSTEGGLEDRSSTAGGFGLASVFSFYNEPKGLYIRDLTPSFPLLRARGRFPFRSLYGQSISLRIDDSHDIILKASDEPYNLGMRRIVRTGRSWRFDPFRVRFQQMKVFTEATSIK